MICAAAVRGRESRAGMGTLRVAIDSTFPLTDARLAHQRAARGHLQGKIVLDVAGAER